jgi:hypothetical protein
MRTVTTSNRIQHLLRNEHLIRGPVLTGLGFHVLAQGAGSGYATIWPVLDAKRAWVSSRVS